MTHLPASVRVYLCITACDMRKSFDGLQAEQCLQPQRELVGLLLHGCGRTEQVTYFVARIAPLRGVSGWRTFGLPLLRRQLFEDGQEPLGLRRKRSESLRDVPWRGNALGAGGQRER